VRGQHREHAARENCDQLTGRELPVVRLAGESGGSGHAVTFRLPVKLGDPGLRQFAMDDRVHRDLLFVRAIRLATTVCRLSSRPPFDVLRMPRPRAAAVTWVHRGNRGVMTVTVMARERDLRGLAGIVSSDRGEPPPEGLATSLISDLSGLIPCDFTSFFGLDSCRQEQWFAQLAPAEANEFVDDDDLSIFWHHYWDSCCSYADRSGDLRSVTKISDFYSARQWHSTGMYRDWVRPEGTEHELMVCLPADPGWTAGPGRTVRLVFGRGPGPDFSERDRALLTLLRPHLLEAYRDAERRRAGTPQLTPRHWELLRLVAAGHTNAQIARRLGVSEGTVRKHLENIYARLQVSSRTAAITRAFPDWPAS
jgi:DNA-binding CsgD family transcriptional regulator